MTKKDRTLVRIGANLRRVREGIGWSQEELAYKCGVHRTYVGGVERAEYNITILTLRKMTRALGMTLQDAIRGASQ